MPRLVVERGHEKGASLTFGVEDATYVVGRSAKSDLILTDSHISRRHFQIEKRQGLYILTDLGSHNGTFLNGARVAGETALRVGDILRVGETLFSLQAGSGEAEGELAGRKIGGYHLLSRVGVGGMGEVYRAMQMSLGRIVALKILSPELTADRVFVERFLSEARAAARLNHPNVITVHEVGEDEGIYYLSMEFVGGGSVHNLVTGGRRVDPLRATEIAYQAAQALAYAEKMGIVHRDIKPDNLMLTETGEVRLSDLGIAKKLDVHGQADQQEGIFGSPHYMAPEQARGLSVDHRSDQYSLGATYYRMLTGRLLFSGKDARTIMEKHVYEPPPPLREVVPDLAPAIYSIVERMLRKKPADRYPHAAALIADLEVALAQIHDRS